ncbi:MAG: bifunctional demethylmenaquinone methyltransferase/2-methoxy-6-polyprenyl-1,4-benzoquinol methylase UbiE [Terriglobia bacterium]
MSGKQAPGARTRAGQQEAEAARAVREMFSRIAPRYDLLNRLLSLSLDRRWRRRTAQALAGRLASRRARALDLCCGTADLALELARVSRGWVAGSDFAHAMLTRARAKVQAQAQVISLVEADALRLPFADGSFAVVSAAFGFRNLANYRRGLEEILRVLEPGGEAAILEFALPERGLFARVYRFYFQRVLPAIGRRVSGLRGPYSYLPASVERFPEGEEFAAWMRKSGFSDVRFQRWTGGTVALYRGVKG